MNVLREIIQLERLFRLFILSIILFGAMPGRMFALNPQKAISQYGHSFWIRENGLPSNNVRVVLQSQDGFLCLGTASGLFCFDGISFNELITDSSHPDVHEAVSALCETRDGSLWVGTQFTGLRRIKDLHVQRYGLAEGFYETQVNDLFETRNGRLLIGTSIGLFLFNDGKFKRLLANPNYIRDIAEDSAGRIWVGTYEGIRIFDENHFNQIGSITTANGLPSNLINYIYVDREATVWVGTFDGLARWVNGKISVYKVKEGLSNYHVNAIFEDHDRNLWVGTQGGISRLSKNKWTSYTVVDGLTDNNVLSFAEDREGSIWVGTDNGLNQLKD